MTENQPQLIAGQQRSKSTSAGFYLGILGLGLIFLGGCFLIGVMIMQFSGGSSGGVPGGSPTIWVIFLGLLYVLALSCFGGALFVMINAVKKLLAN